MNRFKEKWIVYFDSLEQRTIGCQICRNVEHFQVLISYGDFEDVKFDDFGTPKEMIVEENHLCSLSSWQQYINRHFPSSRYVKVRELYYY